MLPNIRTTPTPGHASDIVKSEESGRMRPIPKVMQCGTTEDHEHMMECLLGIEWLTDWQLPTLEDEHGQTRQLVQGHKGTSTI